VHPFDTDTADHCETPREAYEHIAPVLRQYARYLKKDPAELFLYDPYYCEGSTIQHLADLGFENVYNR